MKSLCIAILGLLLPLCAHAQWNDNETPLGDVARAMRRSKLPPAKAVIDNDNFSQLLEQVESRRLGGGLRFSFDSLGKEFQVSGPDVTCSLSFSAQATSLLSDPFTTRTLPGPELAKLDGPATIIDGNLQVDVTNGSAWDVKEITVSLTLVRKTDTTPPLMGAGKLLPAAVIEPLAPVARHPDQSVLYHIKGAAGPQSSATFRAPLGLTILPEQEWHWAIVEAKGVPPGKPSDTAD
jgi:hypothetical protein